MSAILSNLPLLIRMYRDPRCRRFLRRVDRLLSVDPSYRQIDGWRLLAGLLHGEKIARIGRRYVIHSYIPPVPSRALLTFLESGRNSGRPFSDLAFRRRTAPLTAHLCLTERCQYDCLHCSAKNRPRRPELTTAQWIEILAQLQNLGVAHIGLTGGEPLLRDDLEALIRTLDPRSITTLYTNGLALTPAKARSLKQAGLFALSVSLDSADADTHNRMRGDPRAFEAALGALRHARAAGLYTIALAVVLRRELSRENLFGLFKLAHRHGAHQVRLMEPVPSGRLLGCRNDPDIFLSAADRRRLVAIHNAANRRWRGYPKVEAVPFFEGPEKFGCTGGVLHSYITAGGDLWPCDYVPLSFGNVLQQGLKPLYEEMSRAACCARSACWAGHLAHRLEQGKPLCVPEACAPESGAPEAAFFRKLQARVRRPARLQGARSPARLQAWPARSEGLRGLRDT